MSVGYQLTERALVFGGSELTVTDIAVAAGLIDLGERRRVAGLPAGLVNEAIDRIHAETGLFPPPSGAGKRE